MSTTAIPITRAEIYAAETDSDVRSVPTTVTAGDLPLTTIVAATDCVTNDEITINIHGAQEAEIIEVDLVPSQARALAACLIGAALLIERRRATGS